MGYRYTEEWQKLLQQSEKSVLEACFHPFSVVSTFVTEQWRTLAMLDYLIVKQEERLATLLRIPA